MRVIARSVLHRFATVHPDARPALDRWYLLTKAADWRSTGDVQAVFSKAKVINADRVRFEVAGGNYRMIVAFDFGRKIAFVKFIGTHAEYDRIDAQTISLF